MSDLILRGDGYPLMEVMRGDRLGAFGQGQDGLGHGHRIFILGKAVLQLSEALI